MYIHGACQWSQMGAPVVGDCGDLESWNRRPVSAPKPQTLLPLNPWPACEALWTLCGHSSRLPKLTFSREGPTGNHPGHLWQESKVGAIYLLGREQRSLESITVQPGRTLPSMRGRQKLLLFREPQFAFKVWMNAFLSWGFIVQNNLRQFCAIWKKAAEAKTSQRFETNFFSRFGQYH